MFAIAYASYGMGHAEGAHCRHLDDTVWLTHTSSALCDYLVSNHDPGVDTTTAVKARCLMAMENRVDSVAKVAEGKKGSDSIFALSPPWTHAFWAGIGIFACYWILFGSFLGSMAVEAYRNPFDELRAIDGLDDKHDNMEERGLEGYS